MFIILRGSALVYIDTSLTGEEESPLVSTTASPQHKQLSLPEVKPRDKRTDRASLGKYITKYGNDLMPVFSLSCATARLFTQRCARKSDILSTKEL